MVYLSDMSRCRPDSALAEKLEKERWMLIPYEMDEVCGTMIVAQSFIKAPDVTLPLDVSGWHAIYIGYWNPHYTYDYGTAIKVKLSDDPCFYRIRQEKDAVCDSSCQSSPSQYAIQEVFFKNADLAGQDIVIGKIDGPLARKACVAYIKLVPLSSEQVEVIRKERARTDTRKLVAAFDGMAPFWGVERTREDIPELVERYRYSDVGKVLWAVCYGEIVKRPFDTGILYTDAGSRIRLVEGSGTNDCIVGRKAIYKSMEEIILKGVKPRQVLVEHIHGMGLKFDIMFRINMAGGLPSHRVCALMLSIIREAAWKFDVDGINLCFVRGPHFVECERPAVEDFYGKYGEDAREVKPNDPRLLNENMFIVRHPELRQVLQDGTHAGRESRAFPDDVRTGYLTDFIREARRMLDEIGRQKGRHLELSIWAWPGGQNMWFGKTPGEGGLDIKKWIIEGLLDSFICQEGVDPEDLELCRKHDCRFILFPGYGDIAPVIPKTVAESYRKGAGGIAIWDINSEVPEEWEWISRAGHREEMEFWDRHVSECRSIPIKTLKKYDVRKNL